MNSVAFCQQPESRQSARKANGLFTYGERGSKKFSISWDVTILFLVFKEARDNRWSKRNEHGTREKTNDYEAEFSSSQNTKTVWSQKQRGYRLRLFAGPK
jgi:hypothetical protein